MKAHTCIVLLLLPAIALAVSISTGHVCSSGQTMATWTTTATTRVVTTNNLPQHPVYDYCPFGGGGLYCGTYQWCPSGDYGTNGSTCTPVNWGVSIPTSGSAWGTLASDANTACQVDWRTRTCPSQSAAITGSYYDCPQSTATTTVSVPLSPLPPRESVGPTVLTAQFTGVALNGVTIFNSFEASGLTLDAAEPAHIVQDICGGHPTPGFTQAQYHYHRAPVCAYAGSPTATQTPYAETAGTMSPLLGYGKDGFGLYGFQDGGGSGLACTVTCVGATCSDGCNAANFETCHCQPGYWTGDSYCNTTGLTGTCERKPVVDGCGGHFGPVTGGGTALVYHYHSRRSVPFTLGCYGPSWGQCASKYSTMMGANAAQSCHAECPVSNTVSGLCVASGWTTQFNINNVTFASGAASATQVSWFALMLLMVLMSMFLSQ